MNVSQMLGHSQKGLLLDLGDLKLKLGLLGFLFGKMSKKTRLSPTAFRKNLHTDKSFIVVDAPPFKEEKHKLIKLIERFNSAGFKGICKETHPFFGKLSVEEWNHLQVKYLEHHLSQFWV